MNQHPNVHTPWQKWSEDQVLHIAAVYSNPFRWERRRRLFNDFVRHMSSQANVCLWIGEVAFGERPFEVTEEGNPCHIRLRTDCALWNKESVINCVATHFPADYKYGGYFDGDFTCTRHDWALETIHLLQHYHWVQLFSSSIDVTGNVPHSNGGQKPYRVSPSFAFNYNHQDEFFERRSASNGSYNNKPSKVDRSIGFPFGLPSGMPGGAWAWRRGAFDQVGGLLDTCITGAADHHMAYGLIGSKNNHWEVANCSNFHVRKIEAWAARASELRHTPGIGIMGCLDQLIVHHYHGSKSKRGYEWRWKILQEHKFDPDFDLARDFQGLWRWTGNKPALRDAITAYFLSRNEDQGSEKPLV